MSDDAPRPILLGEAPSRAGDRYHRFPLSGRPARVLCEMAGVPPQPEGTTYGRWTWALYERFECCNVFTRYAAATPWSAPEARSRAGALLDNFREDGDDVVVVCLGRRVQAAVTGALDFSGARVRSDDAGAWGGGLFGNFGVWAAPSMIRMPVAGRPREWAPWVVTIPHPSGLNRLLNDPAVRARCGDTLREALALAADPSRVPPMQPVLAP